MAYGKTEAPDPEDQGRTARGQQERICRAPVSRCHGHDKSVGGGTEGAGHGGQVCPQAWTACRLGQLAARAENKINVQPGVRVAKGGGEDIGRPVIGTKDEARNRSHSGEVTRLSSNVNKCGDRVVAVGGISKAQHEAWTAPGSREPVWQAAQSTDSTGPSASQVHAGRINVLLRLQHRSVLGIEPPQPAMFSNFWSSPS